jgi:predicted DNA binding protein
MRSQSQQNQQHFEQVRNLFHFVLNTATLYLWDWNLEAGTVTRYPRTEQLFGLDKTALEPVFGGFTEYVHPDYRDEVVTTLKSAIEDESSYRLQYALELPHNRRVWIEERGTVLDNGGTATRAVGASIDITKQKERERELTWERELNRTLHAALVESRTRADLEQTIVTQLHNYGYELAWIGDLLVDEIKPRVTAGRDAYVTDLDLSLPNESHSTEPVLTAIKEETEQFVDDLGAGTHTAWRENAIEAGFRAEAALPLVYRDVLYGVVGVYAGEAGVFDQTARRLLSELADTLAFVIHNVERKNALASDRIISAKLQLVGTRYYLKDILSSADCETGNTRLIVHETLPYDDNNTIQYVSVAGTSVETIIDAAADHPVVDDVTTIGPDTNPRIQIQHRAQTPESNLATVGTRVRSTSVTENRADILIEVPNKAGLRTAIETLDTSNEYISVLSSVERNQSPDVDMDPLAELTDRQATVLRAAYHRGYFEQPRESSAKDVAQSLGISHPTLLEHLRIAQRKVFRGKFE